MERDREINECEKGLFIAIWPIPTNFVGWKDVCAEKKTGKIDKCLLVCSDENI